MKPKNWRLTPKAAETMVAIGEWTGGQFGEQQAEAYLEVLIAQCTKIASGLAHVQSCRDAFAPDLRDDLRFSRAGQHYVVFVETAQEVLVVDFIHQRMDVLGKLRDGFGDGA